MSSWSSCMYHSLARSLQLSICDKTTAAVDLSAHFFNISHFPFSPLYSFFISHFFTTFCCSPSLLHCFPVVFSSLSPALKALATSHPPPLLPQVMSAPLPLLPPLRQRDIRTVTLQSRTLTTTLRHCPDQTATHPPPRLPALPASPRSVARAANPMPFGTLSLVLLHVRQGAETRPPPDSWWMLSARCIVATVIATIPVPTTTPIRSSSNRNNSRAAVAMCMVG